MPSHYCVPAIIEGVFLPRDSIPRIGIRSCQKWERISSNLLAWFNNFKIFLIEFGFAAVGSNGEPIFDKEMKRWILNVDKTEISVNRSKTRAGGRPEVSFHDPHLPLPSLSLEKSSHSCTGIFGSNAAGECVPVHWQLPPSATSEERERLRFGLL